MADETKSPSATTKQPNPESDTRRNAAAGESEPLRYCPVCSTLLEQHRCKLRCTVCGYYMSCSDYY